MPELAKAKLSEMDATLKNPIKNDKETLVQFNPDSLKVSFANQVASPGGAGDQNGPQAKQFVGSGTTKLSVTLVFDVTSEFPTGLKEVDDVRILTQRVAYFITPKGQPKSNPTKFIPPGVRFLWGSFQFDGIMESMEETLEMFSFEGRPLRATVSISLSQQRITEAVLQKANAAPPVTRQGGAAPGTAPLSEAPSGASLQGMFAAQFGASVDISGGISGEISGGISGGASAGFSGGWQAVAAANGIENPRILQPGQLIDLNPPAPSLSASAQFV
jgi:hypothetical protein